jgi:hypothetical protein
MITCNGLCLLALVGLACIGCIYFFLDLAVLLISNCEYLGLVSLLSFCWLSSLESESQSKERLETPILISLSFSLSVSRLLTWLRVLF